MANILTLPQELYVENNQNKTVFVCKRYSEKATTKNKILLQQNVICFLQNGIKNLHYSNKTIELHNEQIAILSSGNCLSTEKLSNENKHYCMLLFFDDAELTRFFVKYALKIEQVKFNIRHLTEPIIVLPKDDFIRNFLISMEFLLDNRFTGIDEMVKIKFEEFMLYLLEKHPNILLSLQIAKKIEYSDFELKKAVEQNILTDISIEELAFLCNTSSSTFKRRFFKLYQTTPNQYFIQRKMEVASILLSQAEHPSEVYLQVGYENHSNFSKAFKQFFGISPKQYQHGNLTV